jgi:hypothetical protein
MVGYRPQWEEQCCTDRGSCSWHAETLELLLVTVTSAVRYRAHAIQMPLHCIALHWMMVKVMVVGVMEMQEVFGDGAVRVAEPRTTWIGDWSAIDDGTRRRLNEEEMATK